VQRQWAAGGQRGIGDMRDAVSADALAAQIRTGFNQAEFNNVTLSENQLKDWTKAANDLIAQAAALAASS